MNWSRVLLVGIALILPGCEMIDPAAFFSRLGERERARIVRGPVDVRERVVVSPAAYGPARAEPRPAPAPVVTAWASEPDPSVEQAFRELDALLAPLPNAGLPPPRASTPGDAPQGSDPLLADRYDPRNDPNRRALLPEIRPVRIIDVGAVLEGLRGSQG